MATNTDAAPGARGDVLVIFGITGDLARVMTFRSLYRLERRGLLDVPIVGVAVDMEFAATGGEAPTPYEVLLHAALISANPRSRGRTRWKRPGVSCSRSSMLRRA